MVWNRLGLPAVTGIVLAASFATAAADCTCRANGRNYELGQTACLATAQGFRVAMCGMVLNNTSWRISDEGCVAAEVGVEPGSGAPPKNRRSQGTSRPSGG